MLNSRGLMKLKYAIFMGYNGKGFRGLQQQTVEGFNDTIEDSLEEAVFKAGLITENNYGKLSKLGYNRSSRTDKGVHAALNIVSMKFELNSGFLIGGLSEEQKSLPKESLKQFVDLDRIVEATNTYLPPEIRIFGVRLVNRGFNARGGIISRKYVYYCPFKLLHGLGHSIHDYEEDISANQRLLNELNSVVSEQFVGSKFFHNFTRKIEINDEKARRHIIDMNAVYYKPEEKLGLLPSDKKPVHYAKFTIHGQSFLYHMIRKMIGSLIQMKHNGYTSEYIGRLLSPEWHKVWLAPAEGLYLEDIDFSPYNSRDHEHLESLILSEKEQCRKDLFTNSCLLPTILNFEDEHRGFTDWYLSAVEGKAKW